MTGDQAQRDAAELAARAPQYPDHRIWREETSGGTRYIARGLHLNARPYVIIAESLNEIWTELSAANSRRTTASGR